MLRQLVLLCCFLCSSLYLVAQGYYVKDYQVELTLLEDSGLEVTEHIKVHFQEDRRGIIRNIPYEGYSAVPQSTDVARRAQYGDRYALHIIDVQVEGDPFTTYTQSGSLYIRIGDPDVYHRGERAYTITYKVYGALQEFEQNAELPWNVIGTEWDTRIEKASFRINLPGNYLLPDEDFLAYTGYMGSKEGDLTIDRRNGVISGVVNSQLSAGQGISVALRLPKDLFTSLQIPARLITRYFLVTDLKTRLLLRNSGALDVQEEITIEPMQPNAKFVRILNIPPGEDLDGNAVYPFLDELSVRIPGVEQNLYEVHVYPSHEQTVLEIIPRGSFQPGTTIRLDYRVWGALTLQGQGLMLRWNLFSSTAPEPVERYDLQLRVEDQIRTTRSFEVPYPQAMIEQLIDYERKGNDYSINSKHRVISGASLNFNFRLEGDQTMLNNLPQQVYAKEYWIQHFDKEITIASNRQVNIHTNYYPKFRYREGTSSFNLQVPTRRKREAEGLPLFQGMNILGRTDHYLLDFKQHDKLRVGASLEPTRIIYLKDSIPAEEAEFLSLKYSMLGPLAKGGDGYRLLLPVWLPGDEPMRGGLVKVQFERDVDPEAVTASLVTREGELVSPMEKSGQFWTGHIPDNRFAKTDILLDLSMPQKAVKGMGMFSSFRLFAYNNTPLVVALVSFLLLLGLWRWIGRDKPGTIIARFRPPEDMPPSEAGFIYDGKLHGQDMTALIYYWAADGRLKIREIEGKKKKKPDYELIKLQSLPENARDYEKIFFNGLFASGDTIKLSSLKDSFYKTYNKARSAFSRFEKKAGYYATGTRGFGKFIQAIGWIMAVTIVIPLMIYSFVISDFTYAIPALIVAVSLIVFGRIMPRMKEWSQKALDELMGFRLFIRTAESDRLKTLIDEDPKYFGMTLPYAIVMGEGDRWADKFEDIITTPPEWYEGYDSGTFSSRMFTYHMIHSMHDMRSTFTSTPAPSGGSGSSWSGGSSFGGGFSGGGGFGGGGGSSW